MSENHIAHEGASTLEAAADEHASSCNPSPGPEGCSESAGEKLGGGDILEFDPVSVRHRVDGWTPAKQREYVEALADSGVARHAAARVGMSEQSANRLRRRTEARSFDRACEAAARIGARRLLSVACERAIEGTVRRHYYRGEVAGEERVYDNRLLVALIGKLGPMLAPDHSVKPVMANWNSWMDAVEKGLPEPPPPKSPPPPSPNGGTAPAAGDKWTGDEVWEDDDGIWWTGFPPPCGFDGEQRGEWGDEDYERTLSPAEQAVIDSELDEDDALHLAGETARRDRYFEFAGGLAESVPSPTGCELYEPSAGVGEGRTAGRPEAEPDRGRGFAATACPDRSNPRHPGLDPGSIFSLPAGREEEKVDAGSSPARRGAEDLPPSGPGNEPPHDPPCQPGQPAEILPSFGGASNPAPPPLSRRLPSGPDEEVTLYARFAAHIDAVLDRLEGEGQLEAGVDRKAVAVEPPRDPAHGDLATNAAMVLAKRAGTNPRALAGLIAPKLAELDEVESAEVAGPGFINIRLDPAIWQDELRTILAEAGLYGRSTLGHGTRMNVEYVSANPTGPMHMGHCRGAVVGDALASLLEYAGYAVTREYYVNDAGGQVDTLARSAWLRYREALGIHIGEIPEGLYPGDYLKPVGQRLADEFADRYAAAPESEWLELFRRRTVEAMLELIRGDLATLGVHHDLFSSEAEVQSSGAVDRAVAALEAKGLVYRGTLEPPKGKAADDWEPVELLLFRSTCFGDDQDRPLRKSDGSWTYFAADAAYHLQKLEAADELINVWGADHTGTVKRTQAAVEALAGRPALDVKLVQMVRLLRAGEPVKMSKRSGSFVTLAEVVEEVGKDVVRFTMLTRKNDAQMDFDFAKVVEASRDNPVFYVQYAHARISSLHRKAKAEGIDLGTEPDLELLEEDELGLVKLAAQFPRVVEAAALAHEPHRIAFYLNDLAAAFHQQWNKGNDDPLRRFLLIQDVELTRARLELASAIGQIIRNGLGIMGVAAAEEMQ